MKVEINVELWVKGKRLSCPSRFLHELAYIKLHIRAYGTDLSREDAGDRGGATTYTSFPSKIVSNVAACTSVQRSKGDSFSSRSAESLPRATKSAKRTFERVVFWVDEGITSGLLVGSDGPGIGGRDAAGAVRILAAIAAPRRKKERPRPRPRPRPLPRPRGWGMLVCIINGDNVEWRANDAGMRRIRGMECPRRRW